jgi:hypothetical protein
MFTRFCVPSQHHPEQCAMSAVPSGLTTSLHGYPTLKGCGSPSGRTPDRDSHAIKISIFDFGSNFEFRISNFLT